MEDEAGDEAFGQAIAACCARLFQGGPGVGCRWGVRPCGAPTFRRHLCADHYALVSADLSREARGAGRIGEGRGSDVG